jgi:membrane associated rhomboid family serine protease
MAANDYFYDNRPHPANSTPSPAPQYDPRYAPSPQSTPGYPEPPPPGYSSPGPQAAVASPANQQRPAAAATGPSPFDTVFDDHIYPVGSNTQAAGASAGDMSNTGYYPDTAYHGTGGQGGSPEPRPITENIPLRNNNGKDQDLEMDDHIYDAPRRRSKKKRKIGLGELGMFGADRKRIPWVVYFFTTVQVAVFIAEIARNAILTGSPIMIKPRFNPVIGPSTQVLINMGARYVPCMRNYDEIQGHEVEVRFVCPSATTSATECTLSELCGFGGVPNPVPNEPNQKPEPNQWFRFITPIFMHAGLLHIGFNMILQLTLGKDMERAIGPIRFFLVYMSAGIFGFVLGGNFANPAEASMGASCSLFAMIALTLLDLLYSWQERKTPGKDLMFVFLDMIIAFVLGLLPGLDNFGHIGGFLTGLAVGICVLHSPNALRRRMGQDPSYESMGSKTVSVSFFKSPLGFFKGRKPLWWAWWLARAAALATITISFIVLLNNFYVSRSTCSWCKYLSCIVSYPSVTIAATC